MRGCSPEKEHCTTRKRSVTNTVLWAFKVSVLIWVKCGERKNSKWSYLNSISHNIHFLRFLFISSTHFFSLPAFLLNIATIAFETCLATYSPSLHCSSVPAADVVTLVQLLEEEVLNNHLLHLVLEHMIAGPDKQRRPLEIISEHNLRQITDEKQIEEICRKVIEENPKLVQQFKSGKQKVFKALVGEVHRLSEQKANMRLAVEKLQEMLK